MKFEMFDVMTADLDKMIFDSICPAQSRSCVSHSKIWC